MSYHGEEEEEPHLPDESCGHLESQTSEMVRLLNKQSTEEVCTLVGRWVLSFKETSQYGQGENQS